jgi:predicted ATPase
MLIEPWPSITLPSIGRLRRDLAKTSGWHCCSIDRWPCGRLAILTRRLQTLTAQSRMREFGQAASLMPALTLTSLTHIHCGRYAIANVQLDEVITLADEKGALFWKVGGLLVKGCLLAVTGKASDAVPMITSGLGAWRQTGASVWTPAYWSYLARAHAELGQFNDAWRCIGEAITTTETITERWCEANIHHTAGEIALISPEPDAAKAEAHFKRALAVARQQQAKSWELRAATSMARLWRDQGERRQAGDLLAPVYGWFTEGFDTLDLKEAKALLERLKA